MANKPKSNAGGEHPWRVRRICAAMTFFKPPYVGVHGWAGIGLDNISDEELASHIREARRPVAPRTTVARR
jgi:hypothetical protein